MTTHVFIVDENTFKYHLEYMFAGTGAADKDVDFNSSPTSKLHHSAESGLVLMMADGCRVRKNDLIIFYLLATVKHEGMFFGVFQAVDDGIFLDRNDASQFLKNELGKSLLFRLKIQPYEVYPKGVTEWSALDEIKNIGSPYQMLWSLIYRKLKGNRGNTMITIYEADRLISLLRNENNHNTLNCNGKCLTYDPSTKSIVDINKPIPAYSGRKEPIDIMPRLLSKYNDNKAFEAHLQMYITQNVGRGTDKSLDTALGISKSPVEWIGNEVSCGVGMQRIDVMLSVVENPTKRVVMPIELKAVPAYEDNTRQLARYVDWIEQYYLPNRISIIQPVLICRKGAPLSSTLKRKFDDFNNRTGILPLKYIEFDVITGSLIFKEINY